MMKFILFFFVTFLTQSATTDIYVDSTANSLSDADGSANHPFHSIPNAIEHIIQHHHPKGTSRTLWIQPGIYSPFSLNDTSLSGLTIRGIPGKPKPLISGGIEVPTESFKPWMKVDGAYVASLDGLEMDFGGMRTSLDGVGDCNHDKVFLLYGDEAMTLARWPNVGEDGYWRFSQATVDWDPAQNFTIDLDQTPEASRIVDWQEDIDNGLHPFLHGYWEWDWADEYVELTSVTKEDDTLILNFSEEGPVCKPNARWMGVNILSELDVPGEYYIDGTRSLLYFYPPNGGMMDPTKIVRLASFPGAIINVTSNVENVTLSDLEIAYGRHVGINGSGTKGLSLQGLDVHHHGTHGILLKDSRDSTVNDCTVANVGCMGICATGGNAATLTRGNISVTNSRITAPAQWKRSYQPGIFFGGVGNVYKNNVVEWSPHNCILGGGDFGDGVDILVENNLLSHCTYETVDAGGFYSSGQRGSAFVNRGNILRGNTIEYVRNVEGLGVQDASSQAVYLDDQMSAWVVTNNTIRDSEVGILVGGGWRNLIVNNRFERVGTMVYLNAQGTNFDKPSDFCSDISPPLQTQCNTGAAEWMLSKSPAANEWSSRWPEMVGIRDNHLGFPFETQIVGNTYCATPEFIGGPNGMDAEKARTVFVDVHSNIELTDCSNNKIEGS